jgi:hypothetical protein
MSQVFLWRFPMLPCVTSLQPRWTHNMGALGCTCHLTVQHQPTQNHPSRIWGHSVIDGSVSCHPYKAICSYRNILFNSRKQRPYCPATLSQPTNSTLVSFQLDCTKMPDDNNCCSGGWLRFYLKKSSNQVWSEIRTKFPTISEMALNICLPFCAMCLW